MAGLEVAEDVRREMLEGMNQELLLPQIQAPLIVRCPSRLAGRGARARAAARRANDP